MLRIRKHSIQRQRFRLCTLVFSTLLAAVFAASVAQAKTATEWWKEAETHYKNKKYPECIKAAGEALALDPKNVEALRYRGLARYELKDHVGTISDWDRYIALLGDKAAAFSFFNRGLAKRALKDDRQAFKDFDRAAQLQKDYAFAILNRGRCRHALGDYEGAFEDYSHALKLKPGHKEIIADINRLESDVQAGKGMETSPALRELMNARISVFDLYLDDLLVAGRPAFGAGGDPFNPLLESVDYDAASDRLIMFFTLDPNDEYGRMFDSAAVDWKRNMLKQVAETVAAIAGAAPLDETGEAYGLVHITPFRGVKEMSGGVGARVKSELAAKTTVIVQMERGGKTYFASRDPGGRTIFKETP
ncbi:MAG: tetratricopeptide repeat protein [Kiritimatiellae bacterium]|nr:tetratricopeptide repeat protein [Kiritimatiellia bacterium]